MNIDAFLSVDVGEMILRATITFSVLLVLARFLGKKQLSQLTIFNYITGITIGSIAANIASGTGSQFTNGLISLIWWSFLTVVISYIGMKSPKARVLLDDEPTIVIKEGKILEKSLDSLRINIDDLSMLLRQQGVFSTNEVEYAVLEADGKLSILKKVGTLPYTKQDAHITLNAPKYIPTELISDGKIVEKNLKELKLSKEWLIQQLKKQGIQSLSDVFYAELQENGSIFIDKRKDNFRQET